MFFNRRRLILCRGNICLTIVQKICDTKKCNGSIQNSVHDYQNIIPVLSIGVSDNPRYLYLLLLYYTCTHVCLFYTNIKIYLLEKCQREEYHDKILVRLYLYKYKYCYATNMILNKCTSYLIKNIFKIQCFSE